MGRGWFICGGSGKDTVPRPPLRESEGDEVSVKPAPAGEDAPADESLKVHVDLNGVQVYFKIKRSTRMHKVFSALAKKQGVEVTSLRVTFRGARVGGLDTADIVGLRDGDQLDAEIIEPEPAPPVAPPPVRDAAPTADDDAPADSEAARESEFEIWSGDPDEIVAASRKSWPPDEVKKAKGDARKSWPLSEANKGGAPPGAEGTSPVNAYWWTRKVLAENEVDLDDDDDLADGKSRVVFTSVGSC